ncbi:MAG: nitroreductase family protein [Rhabdochlamydiaceae bacterium]|nr:nitroreductase family protein [Rhabdochlamydiaceae bacterium]
MEYPFEKETKLERNPNFPIQPFILNRWSPRSMTAESLSDEELLPLFEAARWSPSSYNNQPWRFFYAKRNTPLWPIFFNLLVEPNQEWCKNAAALVCIVSKKRFDHNNKPCRTHSFDTGAAWMAMALEGASRGFVVHGMEGFDWELAARTLEIPEDYQIEAMAAIGKRGPIDLLPSHLKEREKPSTRKTLEEIAIEGKFKAGKTSKVA